MKKILTGICISLFLLLIYISVEYVELGRPSYFAINNAVSWAKSYVGKSAFPYDYGDGYGSYPSMMGCALFVADSYGRPASDTAYSLWTTLDQHPGDWNAPRGSLVFFKPTTANSGLGHVALSMGNGNIVEAGDYLIKTTTISDEAENDESYLGWAWPPSSWPGRSGGSAVADFMMNMDKFIKESIKSTLAKLHIY